MIPFQPFFLAAANRARGGWIKNWPGQLSRIVFWAIPLSICLWLVKQPEDFHWSMAYFAALVGAAFISSTEPAWGKWWHLGRTGNPVWKDWLMMTFCGFEFIDVVLIPVICVSWKLAIVVLVAGMSIAPCYEIGWRIPSNVKNFTTGPELGEVIYGAVIGLLIWCAVFYNFL